MQHVDEVVDVVGPVPARIQLLGQREERLRVVREVVDVENSFWVRDVVLLHVGIKTCSWSSDDRRNVLDRGSVCLLETEIPSVPTGR